jgi:anti-sigma regulatory factor (Ser/Thr protein kinase)
MAQRQRTMVIRQFIIENVAKYPANIATVTKDRFGITRQAVSKHLKLLASQGVLEPSGTTSGRTYALKILGQFTKTFKRENLAEDVVWRDHIGPLLTSAPKNVTNVCNIAFTEMLNNAIDHSESDVIDVDVLATAATVAMRIVDHGVGVFRKIAKACDLPDEREAILELTKGKLTTSPEHHSGYGVFFTSRMVDVFSMASGKLFFTHIRPDDDWLIESDRQHLTGTQVECLVSMTSERTAKEVYDQFCPSAESGFSKTHVPISLAQYGLEQLVSRSQAKRVLVRFDRFSEVLLDFKNVDFIGQAFADEIFRVFRIAHPEVSIGYANAGPQVDRMIKLAMTDAMAGRQKLLFDL